MSIGGVLCDTSVPAGAVSGVQEAVCFAYFLKSPPTWVLRHSKKDFTVRVDASMHLDVTCKVLLQVFIPIEEVSRKILNL